MKERIKTCVTMSVIVIALLAANVNAQVVTGEYAATFATGGTITTSSGNGYNSGQWYYYPNLDRYIMWFQSTGFDDDRMGDINLVSFVEANDPSLPVTYAIDYGWTKEAWTSTTAPPLPADTAGGLESTYFTRQFVRDMTNGTWYLREGEFTHITRSYLVQAFHPEWVYISIEGTNVQISRTLSVENVDSVPPVIGACCKTSTGDCFLTDDGNCFIGYIYLGDDTTCASCQTQNFTWDFGDAPSSYPVTLARNGAQHTIKTGMYLGIGIDAEPDGTPSANANADLWDDGVAFNTQIISGQSTSVTVTASMLGVINAWLDLNGDGDWADIGEHILADEPVIPGQNTMSFYVPISAVAGQSFARFRYNSSGGIGVSGLTSEGEVEDYAVTILSGSDPDPGPDPGPGPAPDPGVTPKSPSDQYGSKWFQPVDLLESTFNFVYGWNIVTREDSIPLLADDWHSTDVLPVQGFRWWGAFDNWLLAEMPSDLPLGFQFGIWTHNPGAEKPGTLVWQHTAIDWTWAYTGQVQDALGQIGGESAFEFTTLLSQDQWFYPSAAPGTVYWVSITPIYTSGVVSATPWGWLTRQTTSTLPAERILSVFNPAQWPPQLGSTYAAGSPVTYPATTPWDMAFELITSQLGGGASGSNSDLMNAIGDLNDDGVIDINDLYILLGFVLNP